MARWSVPAQLKAVDKALGIALRHGITNEDADAVGAALKTLAWLDANLDLVREIHQIEQTDAVKAIRKNFPEARLSKIRSV
jgi:hypothetical protein